MPTISFKVSLDEARELQTAAVAHKMSLSEFIRQRALSRGKKVAPLKLVTCAHTGAKIFAGMDRTQRLTHKKVKEMLADFP